MNAFPTKILLATDGSADAALAATAAADVVSRGTGSELHVVHVLPHLPRYAYSGVTAPDVYSYVLDKTQEQARLLLDEQVRHIEERGGTVVETHTRRGRFVDEILDLAEEIGAGLILMGSRGLGSVKRLLLGSVAEGIVQNAHCPVLVARGGQEAWPPERVVIGHDGSEAARGAGEFAASIGRLFGARGLLVQVYPRLLEVDIEGREINARLIDDELRREERDLQARVTQVEEHLGKRPKIRIATVGDPASVLLEAAEEEAPEKSLLAVGSRSLGPWKRMGLGSVSTKVLRAARGPVLVYPRPRTKSTSTDDSDTARAVAGNKVGRATAREETALVEALLRPEAYSWRPAAVELVETHISWVFLAGDRVVKVKKPVNYGFIDHTTLESRHQSCTDEVWLNRRLTDEVYLDVAPIVRDSAGDYHVAAEGAPVEWATLMRRLPEEGMLDALLATGAIPPRLGDRLANRLIPFHRNIAPPCRGPAEEVAAASSTAVTENLTELEPFAGRPLSPVQLALVSDALSGFVAERANLLRDRASAGWIREGHGDLRVEHVCFEEGPESAMQIFDCVEFSRSLRCADVASDLAFLLMDLERLGAREPAARLVARYRQAGVDLPDVLLRFYRAHRALVRAKVACLSLASLAGQEARDALAIEAADYLDLATAASVTARPALIAMTGLSGTGKSTVAAALARVLDAPVFASDTVRKELTQQQHAGSAPAVWEQGLYTPEQTGVTYGRLWELATETLANGRAVILDATFLDGKRREKLASVARTVGVPLILLETVCAEETAIARILTRARRGDSRSDATVEVYRRQRAAALASPPSIPSGAVHVRVDADVGGPVDLDLVLAALWREGIVAARIPDAGASDSSGIEESDPKAPGRTESSFTR